MSSRPDEATHMPEWKQRERHQTERYEWHRESMAAIDQQQRKWTRFTWIVFGIRPLIELAILITLMTKF